MIAFARHLQRGDCINGKDVDPDFYIPTDDVPNFDTMRLHLLNEVHSLESFL